MNDTLLHDILCAANADADIEIPVKEPFSLDGISFAPCAPTFTLQDGVLRIQNTDNTPYTLTKAYGRMRANTIYTKAGIADDATAAALWQKRFHLSRPAVQQLEELLSAPQNWEKQGSVHHHKTRAEFTLHFETPTRSAPRFYAYLDPREDVLHRKITAQYQGTTLRQYETLQLGGEVLAPRVCAFLGTFLHYYCKETPDWQLQEYLWQQNKPPKSVQTLLEIVPVFDTQKQLETFRQSVTQTTLNADLPAVIASITQRVKAYHLHENTIKEIAAGVLFTEYHKKLKKL